jgi:hypothetical protein
VVLISISLKTNDDEILSCAYWLLVYHLWRNFFSDLLPIVKFVVLFVELSEFYVLECKLLIKYVIGKHFFPSCGLSFHFLYNIL